MTTFLFVLALLSAILEWLAVARGWRKLEYAAKPGVMLFLTAWLFFQAGAGGALVWFMAAGVLSLAGDIILLTAANRRTFVAGLAAFLLAHCAYILGFNAPPAPVNPLTFGVAFMVIVSSLPMARKIIQSVARKKLKKLVEPVRIYATVISLMLFSAIMTVFRTDWLSTPAYLVSIGAILFVTSDVILAWDKFVRPIHRARLILMITYHLGQAAILAGAAGQFGK